VDDFAFDWGNTFYNCNALTAADLTFSLQYELSIAFYQMVGIVLLPAEPLTALKHIEFGGNLKRIQKCNSYTRRSRSRASMTGKEMANRSRLRSTDAAMMTI
jgi:hypothetical protein